MSVGQLTTQSIQAVHLLANTAGFPAPGGRIFNLRPILSRPDFAKMNPAVSPAIKEPAEIRKRRRSEDWIFSGFPGENEIHSFGHALIHAIQRIQRALSIVFSLISIHPAGQTVTHFPQWTQSAEIFKRNIPKRENTPSIVPTGQSAVQKIRCFQTASTMVRNKITAPPRVNEANTLPALE